MQLHNPPQPGSLLRADILPALDITVTDATEQLIVSCVQLSRFMNGLQASRWNWHSVKGVAAGPSGHHVAPDASRL